jgi:regulator of sirC expression with transglutaminase-like and TPR domain
VAEALEALDALGQVPDAELDLANAALQLARADLPDRDWEAAQAHLSQVARDAAALGRADGAGARAEALSGLLAGRHRYRGDSEGYNDLANANLIRVIERRRGLPVALGILWMHAARAAGWDAQGLDFPAHFLVGLGGVGGQAVVDPFNRGRVLDAARQQDLMEKVAGPGERMHPALLAPVSDRAVLVRLQNNVKLRRLQKNDYAGALVCIEHTVRVVPGAAGLWREAALLRERLGQVAAAIAAWERFLALGPPDELAAQARTVAAALRTRLN